MFAQITHIDDVLPHISYENGIVVAQRDGYTVIDYAFVTNETFSSSGRDSRMSHSHTTVR